MCYRVTELVCAITARHNQFITAITTTNYTIKISASGTGSHAEIRGHIRLQLYIHIKGQPVSERANK